MTNVMSDDLSVGEAGPIEAIERAQLFTQIMIAKRYPRDLKRALGKMQTLATLNDEIAASCFYSIPRGGKTIQGPSVRMAEIARSAWTNFIVGSQEIRTVIDGENSYVVVRGVAHDTEDNIAAAVEVRRRIIGKKDKKTGLHLPPDEDDIQIAWNAAHSIARRNATFAVLPRSYVADVLEKAKKVAVGEAKSLIETRNKVMNRLLQMGTTKERILARLGVRTAEDIGAEQIETLIGLGTAIKEGTIVIEDAFPPETPIAQTAVFEKYKTAETTETPKPVEPAQAPATPPAAPPNLSPGQTAFFDFLVTNGIGFTDFAQWMKTTGRAADADSWPDLGAMPQSILEALVKDPKGLSRLVTLYGKKTS